MARKPNKNQKPQVKEPRINEEIQGYSEVRLVMEDDEGKTTNKICKLYEARSMAKEHGLDLIEISPSAKPPVLKMADYSKYFYELKKQAKVKNQNKCELKEISLSVNISMHDLEIKANKAKEFIAKGDKVKVTLMMKKRELLRREENKKSILEFIVLMSDVAVPESLPKDEGNKSIVILKKKN